MTDENWGPAGELPSEQRSLHALPPRRGARARRRETKASHLFAGIIVALMVLGVCAVVAFWWTFVRPENSVKPGMSVTVEIVAGEGSKNIALALVDAGVVRNANGFRLSLRQSGKGSRLLPGVYHLSTGMPDGLVIDALVAGPPPDTVTVTIPEGFRIEQIAARFAKQAGVSETDFLDLAKHGAAQFAAKHPALGEATDGSLEGYLFPKTYTIERGAPAADVIDILLSQFDKETADLDLSYSKSKNLTLRDIVIIASIIERETKLPEERAKVSSVVYNRLHLRMRLQMCSTVVYVLNKPEMRLTLAETRTESPYNTYLHPGLPPGPIASPGLASLEAAAHPATSKYLYYVLTGKNGSHTFASNNAEFLRAKAKSKRVFGR